MTTAPQARRAARARPQPVRVQRDTAAHLPVARIAIEVSLAHLDRPFDYLVAEDDDAVVQPGVRVRVRFAGRLVNGFVLERAAVSEHVGRLAMIDRIVSPEVVLTPAIARLCRAVADRYAGTMSDVVRLAVPPRHARVEAELVNEAAAAAALDEAIADGSVGEAASGVISESVDSGHSSANSALPEDNVIPDSAVTDSSVTDSSGHDSADSGSAGPDSAKPDSVKEGWSAYPAGPSFLAAVAAGRPARAVWSALPGGEWSARLAEAARTAYLASRGAILVVADARDLAQLDAALQACLPHDAFVTLSADLGPAERYRRFLKVSRGQRRIVAGTRGAVFAPVRDLALVALFDDGDDLLAEPRAPYPHAREVAMLRSMQEGAALLIGGFARTAEGELLLESGWAKPIIAPRAQVRLCMPRIEAAGDDYAVGAHSPAARARLTPAGFSAARQALDAHAPVLLHVPRGGYLPGLACADCRRPARCRRCSGPLAVPRGARTPTCRWCGVAVPRWVCPACASDRLKATVIGAARTAEEIGSAFAGVRVMTSTAGKVLSHVDEAPLIVVATPGAEPVAEGGYGAALLLDGGLLLGRPDLRAAEETVRRWMAAAALVRPAAAGGRVVIGSDVSLSAVQALVRWDPATFAGMELAGRRELGFPPAVAMASIEGSEAVVGAALAELALPPSAAILGPVPAWRPTRAGQKAATGGVVNGGPTAGDGAMVGHASGGELVTGAEADQYVRALVRVPAVDRRLLAAALKVLAAARSARKDSEPIRIEVDPAELG
ncbi:MAG: primosomal protein N' [Nakamurella sp.]